MILLLAYAYTCEKRPDGSNPLSGYCNLVGPTKASPLTHFVIIGYFIFINIQIASILTEDNSPFKVRTYLAQGWKVGIYSTTFFVTGSPVCCSWIFPSYHSWMSCHTKVEGRQVQRLWLPRKSTDPWQHVDNAVICDVS